MLCQPSVIDFKQASITGCGSQLRLSGIFIDLEQSFSSARALQLKFLVSLLSADINQNIKQQAAINSTALTYSTFFSKAFP